MARDITYLTDVFLITCVVESGLADKIMKLQLMLEHKEQQLIMQEELALETEWDFLVSRLMNKKK